MPELGPSGSVRGAVSNHRSYRDPEQLQQDACSDGCFLALAKRESKSWRLSVGDCLATTVNVFAGDRKSGGLSIRKIDPGDQCPSVICPALELPNAAACAQGCSTGRFQSSLTPTWPLPRRVIVAW
jgi:hypothetical protein